MTYPTYQIGEVIGKASHRHLSRAAPAALGKGGDENEGRSTEVAILQDRADRRIPRCIDPYYPALDRKWSSRCAPDQWAGSHFRGGFPGVPGGS